MIEKSIGAFEVNNCKSCPFFYWDECGAVCQHPSRMNVLYYIDRRDFRDDMLPVDCPLKQGDVLVKLAN